MIYGLWNEFYHEFEHWEYFDLETGDVKGELDRVRVYPPVLGESGERIAGGHIDIFEDKGRLNDTSISKAKNQLRRGYRAVKHLMENYEIRLFYGNRQGGYTQYHWRPRDE